LQRSSRHNCGEFDCYSLRSAQQSRAWRPLSLPEEFPSRVPTVGFCHYVLTNNRPIDIPANRVNLKLVHWEIHDRQLLSQEVQEEPWYIGPELTYFARDALFANEPGPHPSGLYMTQAGLYPR
jgi:hypothetical protein